MGEIWTRDGDADESHKADDKNQLEEEDHECDEVDLLHGWPPVSRFYQSRRRTPSVALRLGLASIDGEVDGAAGRLRPEIDLTPRSLNVSAHRPAAGYLDSRSRLRAHIGVGVTQGGGGDDP